MYENTVFNNKIDPKFNKIWENREFFPFLTPDKIEEIDEILRRRNIKEVLAFDMIDPDWRNWDRVDSLALVVMPLANGIMDEAGSRTRRFITDRLGIKITKTMMPIDIYTDEIVQQNDFCVYFPDKNIILLKMNIFADRRLFDLMFDSMEDEEDDFYMEFRVITQKELRERLVDKVFGTQIRNALGKIKNDIENLESERNRLFERSRRIANDIFEAGIEKESYEKQLVSLGPRVMEEIESVKKLEFVKDIYIKDRLYIEFKDIYIHAPIIVKKEDTEVPELKKILIGDLKFVIMPERVLCYVSGKYNNRHPHIGSGAQCCFGSEGSRIGDALGKMDIKALASFLYSWATSYNENSCYVNIQNIWNSIEAKKREENGD